MTNILVPAKESSFFSGFKPLLAIKHPTRNTARVANCTAIVGNVSYVSALRNTAQLSAFRLPLPLLAM